MMPVSNKVPAGPRRHTMYIDITWKIALPALVGLFVIATVVMNSSSAESRGIARTSTQSTGVTRSASPSSVCNILFPVPCAYVQPY
jgi:hypothetical protein